MPYEEAKEVTTAFFHAWKKEELSETKPDGIIFAVCADGDVVLLASTGVVFRFSHEEPKAISEWKSLAQFCFDAILETD